MLQAMPSQTRTLMKTESSSKAERGS